MHQNCQFCRKHNYKSTFFAEEKESVSEIHVRWSIMQEFGLIDKKELAPLQELIESIIVPY